MKYKVKKTGKTWSIFQGKKLVEGGFFSRDAADDACKDYEDLEESYRLQAEYDDKYPPLPDMPAY